METAKNYLKNASFFASLLGLYYLFAFTYTEKISFPLEISVLPSLVLAIGLLAILFTLVIIFYSSVSFFVIFDPLKISYRKFFYAKPHHSLTGNFSSIINFLLFFCFTPALFFTLSLMEYRCTAEATVLSIFIMPILFSYYAMTSHQWIHQEKLKCFKHSRFWRAVIVFYCVDLLAFTSVVIFLKYVKFGLKIESDEAYQATLFCFVVLSYLIHIPPNEMKVDDLAQSKKPILKKMTLLPASLAYAIALIFAIWPPVAANTAAATLRFLQIGGGLERSYYFPDDSKIAVPKDLADCADKLCVTKSLNVLLDLGSFLYVKGKYFNEENTVISLPRKDMFMIIHPKKESNKDGVSNNP
ncbi:MAG: hypothetical protein EOO52_10165 [Gammaproteobacteria bacterium]|nr:MAG: hypothetical protein EOO52_10165 [Gammaproteobacteria bacterium]